MPFRKTFYSFKNQLVYDRSLIDVISTKQMNTYLNNTKTNCHYIPQRNILLVLLTGNNNNKDRTEYNIAAKTITNNCKH